MTATGYDVRYTGAAEVCRECGATIKAGTRSVWRGGGDGMGWLCRAHWPAWMLAPGRRTLKRDPDEHPE